jgi:hypothetical protein
VQSPAADPLAAPPSALIPRYAVVKRDESIGHLALMLLMIATEAEGISGRSLRKLPFLAHVYYLKEAPVTPERFLEALKLTVSRERVRDMEGHGAAPTPKS